MTDTVRRGILYVAPSAVGMLLPFLTLPVMTRWLTPEDYGTVAVAQIVAALFMGVASLGVSTGLERNFFAHENNPAQLARLVYTAHALVVAGAVAMTAVLLAVAPALSHVLFGHAAHAGLLLAMSLASTLGVFATMQLVYLRNRGRARTYMVYSVSSLALETTATLVLVVSAGAGVWAIPLGMLIGKTVVVGTGWVLLARELPPGLDGRLARELLAIGLPLVPRAFTGVADNGVDRLSLNWLVSLGQAGFFGLANRIGYAVFSVMTSFEQLYIPQVYRLMFQGGPAAAERIGRYLTPYFYLSSLIAATVVLFVEEALWVLVAPAFWPIKYVAAILAAYYGQLFFGKVIGAQWVFLKKTWYATPVSLVRLTLHLGLTLLLVGPLGALGAAIALFVAGTVVDGVCLVIAQRQYPVAYEVRVVAPVMALLYAAAFWGVVPAFWPVTYGAHLTVRLIIFAMLLGMGGRWIPSARAQLGTLVRGPRLEARVQP